MATRDILYIALTRPALKWGVPVEAFALNLFGCFAAGAWLSGPTIYRTPFMFWALGIPVHYWMRWYTSRDYLWCHTLYLRGLCLVPTSLFSFAMGPIKTATDIKTAIVSMSEISFQRRPIGA